MTANDSQAHSGSENTVSRAYRDGAAQGKKDAAANHRIRYLPSLFKALLNSRYRTEYVRGYKDAYFQTQRRLRQAELKQLSSRQSNQPQRER